MMVIGLLGKIRSTSSGFNWKKGNITYLGKASEMPLVPPFIGCYMTCANESSREYPSLWVLEVSTLNSSM
jgi:hypothetical protein